MHKCLIVKSDYCDFNWWNSCSYFDEMFGYVNLMIIKLLMMNLHAWNVYMWILCILHKIGEIWYCCCWIVDEFKVNWCCCCYEVLVLMIDTMGIHNYEVVVWIELFLKVLWKMGKLMICDGMMFRFQVLYSFDCLLSL